MSSLKMIFRTELLLLIRNKLIAIPLIINVLLWGYIVISYEVRPIHFEERAAAFYGGFIWMLFLNLLIVGLFAVYMASKDRASEFEYLVVTYRVKNTEWITGKWLVAQLYGLCITLTTLFIQIGWLVSGKMPAGELAKNTIYVFVQMEGAFFLLISLGFLFGILIKNVFAYLFIPAALVLSLGLPFDYTGVAYTYDNPRFHLLTPFDYMFIDSPYEGIWGINRVFESTMLHQLIVLLLGVVFILLTLLLFRSDRRVPKEKKAIPILIIMLIVPIILLGSIRFTQYNKAFEQFITTGKQYMKEFEEEDQEAFYDWVNAYYDTHLDHEKYDFSMEQTNLAVQLQPHNQIKVTGNLLIKNNGDMPTNEVYLTLYHGLNLTECNSESKITCVHDKDFITVQLVEMIEPGEEFRLNLGYEGNILQYRDEGYVEHSFIGDNRIYLPKEAGWYPLIGKRQLVVGYEHGNRYVQFEQRNGRLVEDYPTAFTVEIINENKEIPLALTIPEVGGGMYKGISQYGLSLVGGNLTEATVDGIRVIGHTEVLGAAKEKIEKSRRGWNFIEEWLGVPMTPEVIYILNYEHYYLTQSTPSQELLVWGTDYLGDTREDTIAYELRSYLTNNHSIYSMENMDYNYLNSAMIRVILNQLDEEVGFKEWYMSNWGVHDEEEAKFINLLHGYEEKGNKEFEDVVKYLYLYVDQLKDKNEFDMEVALELYERESGL